MPKEATPAGVAPMDAVVGPFFDTSLQEFAHALFDMLDVPVLGREEDAAEQVQDAYEMLVGPHIDQALAEDIFERSWLLR